MDSNINSIDQPPAHRDEAADHNPFRVLTRTALIFFGGLALLVGAVVLIGVAT